MRVFVTGASGWIGSAVVPELLAAGHQVVGLARSRAAADALTAAGVEPHPGSLDDLESLRSGAQAADGVIHLAFKHDFSDYAGAGRTERAAMTTLGDALVGSDRPLLLASGLAGLTTGRPATEQDAPPFAGPEAPRGGAEGLALEYAERGVRTVRLRFAPTVHGEGDHGFTAALAAAARATGVAGFVGDGGNRWAAVHRSDAARLVALALEASPAGSAVHAAGEEGVETRRIAEALGGALDVPVRSIAAAEAPAHFGWIGTFFGMDAAASSAVTRDRLGWTPTGPTLLEDIASGFYTAP